jgi:hypothetical protein
MTVEQRKEELRKRKLPVNGVKAVLLNRLLGFFGNPNNNKVPSETAAADGRNLPSAGFAETAAWREFKVEEALVPEPNSNPNLVDPTVPQDEKEYQKHNFSATFNQPPFTAKSPVIEIGCNGKPIKNKRGEVQWTNEISKRKSKQGMG